METKDWKWFEVGKLFNCNTTKHAIQQNLSKGNTPLVTRSAENNGVNDYVNPANCQINKSNCITIGAEGIFAFYQPNEFITGVKVYTLRHNCLNPNNALFICTLLNREAYRYNYGNARILEKIKREKIKLPAKQNDIGEWHPDWQWIEDYVKDTLVPKLTKKAKFVWQEKYETSPLKSTRLILKIVDWRWYNVSDVFVCSTTKHVIQQEIQLGRVPFVSRSASNNGISGHVDSEGYTLNKGECITIGAEGLYSFFQPNDFVAGVKIYTLSNNHLNKYNAMFICVILDREVYRYNYGNARILDKIKREKIKLPSVIVDGEYEPDWKFMENYIKSLPYSKEI